MCGCLHYTDEFCQPPEKDTVLGFSQSNTRLNDRYRILKPLGKGGFGKTFLCVDEKDIPETQEYNVYVIKQFSPQCETIQQKQKAAELFQQESLHLAQLGNHPQIPQFFDAFEQDGQQYLVQEWIDGQTLEQELDEVGTFTEVEILQLLEELLPVLQFIHTHQLIHRDIKPANIVRCRRNRQLVLVDFGAAKCFTDSIFQNTGTLIGSAEYAAPEQIKGKALFASDLYSLGVTCLHLLTQMSPFDLYDCTEDTWVWHSYLTKPISPSLEKILCQLVQPATKRRYQSAAQVLIDLNSVFTELNTLPNTITGDDDNFETPYFGFSREEYLQSTANISIAANLDIHSVAAVTVFDPQTQNWYHLPPKTEGAEIAQKVAMFLGTRLAAAAATPPSRNQEITTLNNVKTAVLILTVVFGISFTYLIIALGIKSSSNFNSPKVENLRRIP